MGKSYAQRKPVENDDLFHTPVCCTELLLKGERLKNVIEPACGDNAIVDPLRASGINVNSFDIKTGDNFLELEGNFRKNQCMTNPPFFLWDDFVNKSKELEFKKTVFLGRGNYLGTVDRYESGIFHGLKHIYWFNRYIDYRTPRRDDGLFHVGALLTGWFVWERNYTGKTTMSQLDVQPWAKLGGYNEEDYIYLNHLGIGSTWFPEMKIDSQYIMEKLQKDFHFKYTQKQLDTAKDISKILLYTKRQLKGR